MQAQESDTAEGRLMNRISIKSMMTQIIPGSKGKFRRK